MPFGLANMPVSVVMEINDQLSVDGLKRYPSKKLSPIGIKWFQVFDTSKYRSVPRLQPYE